MILLGQGKESVEKFREATLEVALLVREDIKKQTAERVKLASFTLPLPPSTQAPSENFKK